MPEDSDRPTDETPMEAAAQGAPGSDGPVPQAEDTVASEPAPVTAGDSPVPKPDRTDEEILDERAATRARAEEHLKGPALTVPDDAPDPAAQRDTWGEAAIAALSTVREDLEGRRVGLAISGGGSLGSFEAGAVRFLYDHLELEPVAITGNSAGAMNAAKLAHGNHREPRAIDEVERLWRAMRINSDMWEPEPWLEKIMASAQWASAIRAHPGNSGQSAGAMRVAVRVLNSWVRRPEETDGTIDAIRDALKAQSLLSLAPIAELIAAELDTERIASSGIALRVGSVALESGELRYVGEDGSIYDRHGVQLELPKVPLIDGILASASIPVAFPPVLLGDEHYVDGGAREILPLQVLVESLGVERSIAVSAGSTAIAPSTSYAEKGLFDIMRRVTSEIAPNETLRKELSPPGGWNDSVRLVVPDLEVHDTMTIDAALIAISFDYGWMHAADSILGLDPVAKRLTAELTETRISLRRLAGPLPALLGRDSSDALLTTGISEAGWVDGESTLTARLREQAAARVELGAPVPPSLLAWLG